MSNHNSFRVLFDKIASVYFKDKFIFLHWKWPSDGTNTVPIVPAYCRSLLVWNWHTGVNVPHAPARQISVLTIVFLCLFWKITFVCNWCKLLQATDVFRVAETTASINWDNCTNFAKAQKPTCYKCFQCGLCGSGVMLQRTPQNGQCKLHNFRFFVQGGPNLAIGLPTSWQCLRRSTCRDEIVLSTKFGTVPEESAVIFFQVCYVMTRCLSDSVPITCWCSVETDERIKLVFITEASFRLILHCVVRKFRYLHNMGTPV